MNLPLLIEKLVARYHWNVVKLFARRNLRMKNSAPIVSFTFDDFPRSALHVGGSILNAHGCVGTYYASLGLLDQDSPVGRIASAADVVELVARGHELGCHTFGHCNAWSTEPAKFEESILENRRALAQLLPGAAFKTFSYPINFPRLRTKSCAGRYFACCRGGSQNFNRGTVDLNNALAFFLELSLKRPEAIRRMLELNNAANGWLIFATHDIAEQPTRFGCSPSFFDKVVRWAKESGARILPVAQALDAVAGGDGGYNDSDHRRLKEAAVAAD